jgi:hypothetical protein
MSSRRAASSTSSAYVDVTDQHGARLAAIKGNTPLLPGDCPA